MRCTVSCELRHVVTIPNLFTLLRVAMTPYILLELARGEYMIAGWTFGAAAFTDTLDGFIARRFDSESRVGLYLDPMADKLLLSSIYIGLMLGHAIPAWLVAVVFGRDLWILLLSGIALRFTKFRESAAERLGQSEHVRADHDGGRRSWRRGRITMRFSAELPTGWSGWWWRWRSSARRLHGPRRPVLAEFAKGLHR